MPWTLAHPAAVLPFRRFSGAGRLSFGALVIGSMSPDFVYYIGRFDLGNFTHSPLGVLVTCLPAGLLVLALALWLRDPIAQNSSSAASRCATRHRPRAPTLQSPPSESRRRFPVAWSDHTCSLGFLYARRSLLRKSHRIASRADILRARPRVSRLQCHSARQHSPWSHAPCRCVLSTRETLWQSHHVDRSGPPPLRRSSSSGARGNDLRIAAGAAGCHRSC